MTFLDIPERLDKLSSFRDSIHRFLRSTDHDEKETLRRGINLNRASVEREVIEAGQLRLITIAPPPAVGGLIMREVNPFDMLFDRPYGQSVIPFVIEMIDSTIGVMSSSDYQAQTEQPKGAALSQEEKAGYVFIAMPMNPNDRSLEDVHDAIKEACRHCGLHAERVDEPQSNERITNRILESITRAQYVIVDLTHSRPNVFYEAGFAQGKGKTPIYIARSGTPSEFDLKDYPIIYFDNMRQLKSRLEDRLRGPASRVV